MWIGGERRHFFSKEPLEVLNKPAQARWLSQYYGQNWPEQSRTASNDHSFTPTGRDPEKKANLRLITDLKGKMVKTEQDENVGKIAGFLVDFKNPDFTFALLEPASFIRSKDLSAKHGLFAVPMSAFITGAKENEIISDLTPGQFEDAKPFTAENWTTASGSRPPPIFRYYEK